MTLQNVVNTVAENEVVANIEHAEPFYLSAEFWVGMAFVLTVAVIAKPLYFALKGLVQKRIARIKEEFQEAENLKLEAQKLYAEYERKLLNKDKELSEIIAAGEEAVAAVKERKMKELNDWFRQKQAEVDGRIELAKENAGKEINTLITTKTMDILKKIISAKLTKADYNHLIDKSIDNIKNITLTNK